MPSKLKILMSGQPKLAGKYLNLLLETFNFASKLLVNQKFLEINQLGSTRLLNFHSKLDGRVDELDHLVHVGDIQTPGGDSRSAKPNTRWIESRLVPRNCVLVARNANRLQDKFTLSSTKRSRTLLEIHVNDMAVSASSHHAVSKIHKTTGNSFSILYNLSLILLELLCVSLFHGDSNPSYGVVMRSSRSWTETSFTLYAATQIL